MTVEIEGDDDLWASAARFRELRARLQEIAPAYARWLLLPEAGRGPPPDVHPRHRAEVARLLEESDRLAAADPPPPPGG